MNPVFADRFKSARLLNGFSLQDLADAIDNKVSRQALHRYEKGEVIPDSEMLNIISEALNVRPDYFFRDTKVEIAEVEFRNQKKLPAKEEQKIIEQTREYLSRYLELEEILGVSGSFINPLSDLNNISTYGQVNEAAEKLRKEWGLGSDPLFNVIEILEDKHIKVIELDVSATFNGLQTWVNGNIPVIAWNINYNRKKDRIRFTLLHELGHLLFGDRFGDVTDKQKETLCHQFAGAMLLPESSLKSELGAHRNKIHFKELAHIKQHYGISMQAVIMRARDCGIINEHYTKQFFYMMNQMNWKVDEPVEYEGIESSGRFDRLLYRALAEELITMSKAAALKNMKLADFRKEALVV